jgi:uncharacterized protein YdhG (YjbR/CyaY superfamily)
VYSRICTRGQGKPEVGDARFLLSEDTGHVRRIQTSHRLYPTPSAVIAFANDLSKFVTADASIQFPLDKPLPLPLIRKITAFRVRESIEEDRKWRT